MNSPQRIITLVRDAFLESLPDGSKQIYWNDPSQWGFCHGAAGLRLIATLLCDEIAPGFMHAVHHSEFKLQLVPKSKHVWRWRLGYSDRLTMPDATYVAMLRLYKAAAVVLEIGRAG